MRGPWKRYKIVTYLVIDDCVSDIIRKFRNGLKAFIVSYIARSLDTVRFYLKSILNAIKGTRKKSMGLKNEMLELHTRTSLHVG